MLSRGMAAAPIAEVLRVSANQVHRRIYPELVQKLRVRHISEAATAARNLGVLIASAVPEHTGGNVS
jgi:hypothetical protein